MPTLVAPSNHPSRQRETEIEKRRLTALHGQAAAALAVCDCRVFDWPFSRNGDASDTFSAKDAIAIATIGRSAFAAKVYVCPVCVCVGNPVRCCIVKGVVRKKQHY